MQDSVALITGGAGAIGLALAAACAEAGARIAIADRDREALRRAGATLAGRGLEALEVELDVSDAGQWSSALGRIEDRLGPVRFLFNNAGVSALGVTVEDMTTDYWQRVVAINLTGVLLGTQAVVRNLRRLGLTGHVVNTASIAGLGLVLPGAAAYAATKSAVVALSEVLELELRETGIGVSVLCPGPVRSELWRSSRGALQLADVSSPPEASRMGSASPDAMDPVLVAAMVIDAVEAKRFYIATHPEFSGQIAARHERLMVAFDQSHGPGAD